MRFAFTLIMLIFYTTACAQSKTEETSIKIAVLAAPADQRDGATVLGFDENGEFVTLRKGSNQTVCIADDPKRDGISVSCYHSSLEPFMKRGRELRTEGKGRQEIFEIRENEVKSGQLKMPDKVTLHVLSGSDAVYNEETGTLENANLRWVIYIPYATTENTGLPLAPPFPGAPWLMDPGTHRAHIMITPPKN